MKDINFLNLVNVEQSNVKIKKDENKLIILVLYAFSFLLIFLSIFIILFCINSNKRVKIIEDNKIVEELLKNKYNINNKLHYNGFDESKNEINLLDIKEFYTKIYKYKPLLFSIKKLNNNLKKIFRNKNSIIKYKFFDYDFSLDKISEDLINLENNINHFDNYFFVIKEYNKRFKKTNTLINEYKSNILSNFKFISNYIKNKKKNTKKVISLPYDKNFMDFNRYFMKWGNFQFTKFYKFNFKIFYKNIISFVNYFKNFKENLLVTYKPDINTLRPKKIIQQLYTCTLNMVLKSSETVNFTLMFVNFIQYNINNSYLWKINRNISNNIQGANILYLNEFFFFEINNYDNDIDFKLFILKNENESSIYLLEQSLECIIYNNLNINN